MASELEKQRDFARSEAERTGLRRPATHSRECRQAKKDEKALERHRCTRGPERCACECHDATRLGPPTDAELAVWAQLADELDKYLAGDGSVQLTLLEDGGTDPVAAIEIEEPPSNRRGNSASTDIPAKRPICPIRRLDELGQDDRGSWTHTAACKVPGCDFEMTSVGRAPIDEQVRYHRSQHVAAWNREQQS